MTATTNQLQQSGSESGNAIGVGEVTFSGLLTEAITKPGRINVAYQAFHNYSLGNMMAAMFQLDARGIELGPIASFMSWKEKGRAVKKGGKAIALCMPITCKGTRKTEGAADEEFGFSRFIWRKNWFVLSETEGEAFEAEVKTPAWSAEKALTALEIAQIPFNALNGNWQGYATGRSFAINPLAAFPHKTRFHEMAHIMLGHTAEGMMEDSDRTPRDIREVEAEATAYILCALLELPGMAESRHYVQSWLDCAEVSERSAQRIYKAADSILKAGQ